MVDLFLSFCGAVQSFYFCAVINNANDVDIQALTNLILAFSVETESKSSQYSNKERPILALC